MSPTWTSAAGWLGHTLVGGGVLLLLTRVLMGRTRQPARRQRLGEWGLAAALLGAVLNLGPAWLVLPWGLASEAPATASAAPLPPLVTPPPAVAPPQAIDLPVDPDFLADIVAEVPPAAPAPAAAPPEPAPPVHVDNLETLCRWGVLAYGLIACSFLARWLLGYVALARLLRGATPAPGHVAELFAAAAGSRRPRLLVSSRVRVPLSFGLWRPTVLLPAAMYKEADPARLRWVFAHELTHLERGDGWSSLLFAVGQALYFVFPWFWGVRRQVRLCQEHVADAAAAGHDECAADYAAFLLSLMAAPAVPLTATGVSGHSSDLFWRVTMLLQNPLRVERHCPRHWLASAAGALLGLAVLVSGVGVRAEDPPPVTAEPGVRVQFVPAPQPAGKGDFFLRTEPPRDVLFLKQPPLAIPADPNFKAYVVPGPGAPIAGQWVGGTVDLSEDLRKLLEKIEKNPDKIDTQELRKELQKILSQRNAFGIHVQPNQAGILANHKYAQYYATGLEVSGAARLGLHLEKPSPVLAEQLDLPKGAGLVITSVKKDSPADKVGLKVNDVLLELDGKAFPSDVKALDQVVAALKENTEVNALVFRKGKRETLKGLHIPKTPAVNVLGDRWVQPQFWTPGIPGVAGDGVMTTTFRRGDHFTARHQEGSLIISVTGTVADGKAKVSQIHVQDGSVANDYDNVESVPERHRDKVNNLIESSTRGTVRVERRP